MLEDLLAGYAAQPGRYDELLAGPDEPRPQWQAFLSALDERGSAEVADTLTLMEREIRENGITYNVYADADGPQRPWSVDLFPLILSQGDWAHIERGVLQRARLLDRVMADVYGPQELLRSGLLPSALVQGHPGYLRAMHGVQPVGGTHLHIAAFDMARDAQGDWWVVTQRTPTDGKSLRVLSTPQTTNFR